MSEEINPVTFEEKKQLFESLLSENVAASCNEENHSVLGISLLLSTAFDLFKKSVQKTCLSCSDLKKRLTQLEDDLLVAQNEAKRQNLRFKKARRQNFNDEDRIDELKAELARATRGKRQFPVKSAGSVAKRSCIDVTKTNATDDVPVRSLRDARLSKSESLDSVDWSGSDSQATRGNESRPTGPPSRNNPFPAASPAKNESSQLQNDSVLQTSPPHRVLDSYETQVFAPERLAPQEVVIPETFLPDEFQDDIVPVTPDLPSSNYLKTTLAKRETVAEIQGKSGRSSKSDCLITSKKSSFSVVPTSPAANVGRESGIIEVVSESPNKYLRESNGFGTSPKQSAPRSPVIGRVVRAERSRLRLTTGLRTDLWVTRTSGAETANEQTEAVVPVPQSPRSTAAFTPIVGGARSGRDTVAGAVDDGQRSDIEPVERRVADGWSLKPARSLRERSSNGQGQGRSLQQAQLALFVRPKVTDLTTLPEFNGGVRASETAMSPSKSPWKRPPTLPPIHKEPDFPETSQDCFNRCVGFSSTLLPGVERIAKRNSSFSGVSQVPKDGSYKARSSQIALFGTVERNASIEVLEDNDPELLMELMNQPEPIKQKGVVQHSRRSMLEGKQGLADQFKDLVANFDMVPNRDRQEPTFKYKSEVVRKKSERDKLQGWSCIDCKKWWDACPGTEEERKRQMNRCAKHRGKFQPPDTPPGYWDLNFPSTQEMKDRGMMSETIVASPRRPKPARRKKLL